ncbi:nuclear transport factor 2 family protein [Streptomyces sp. NBC_00247]|uniref:nuclear transport factor 2 family protein n=1 Tax=Streptomyces sp. NBC_00247 TaxID=2975689 RepID=UPI002E2AD5C9|nr:nuclear transport factor 2 family protein [Streptomyces sp. NBC_00247]
MSDQIETPTEKPSDVVRGLYDALSKGDVPGLLARLAPDVIVDEPLQLPYGGVHQGREVFVQSVLGAMMGYADVAITDAEVFEGAAGVVGTLTGTLTAHATGEEFPLTMVEIHQVEGGTVRKIDVYTKNPHELGAFYARAEAGIR